MINKILTVILCIVIPYAVTTFAFNTLGPAYGFGVMILFVIALFLYLRPAIYNIMGRKKYFNDHDEGFKWLEKSYKTGRMKPQQILIYAYLLIRDGQLSRADKLISGVLYKNKAQLTKDNILAANLNRAIIDWKRNDLESAIERMEDVYDQGYRSTVHYATLGIFYIMNNNLEKAKEFCIEGADFSPDDASILDNLGLVYYRLGDLKKAEEIYEKLFKKTTPEFIEAYYNYGMVLEDEGNLKVAEKYYKRALGCPEKYLSTVKLTTVENALSRVENKLD